MILSCTCNSEYQDRTHGKGMRVHNVNKDISKARCTICGVVVFVKKEAKK